MSSDEVTNPEIPLKKKEVQEEKSANEDQPKASKEVAEAKSPTWKKVLYWIIGIVAAIGAFIGLIFILKSDEARDRAKEHIDKAKAQIAQADLEAKIKTAEANNEEKKVIDKLKEIREMDDEYKKAEELSKLL